MSERPTARGLLVCETVVVAEGTRNATPVNCFGARVVDRVPSEQAGFVVAGLLANGYGRLQMGVIVVGLDTDETVYRWSAEDVFINRMRPRWFVLKATCVLPAVTDYEVNLLADGHILATTRLAVKLRGATS